MSRTAAALILVSAAAWGLGIAISAAAILLKKAPSPGQLPGLMTTRGLDARGPFIAVALFAILPVITAIAGRLVLRWLNRPFQSWVVPAICSVFVLGLWSAFLQPHSVTLAIVGPPVMVAVILLFCHRELSLTRRDLILIPAWLAAYLAVFDLFSGVPYVVLIWLSLAAIAVLRGVVRSWSAFTFAPLAFVLLVKSLGLPRKPAAVLVLLVVMGAPFLVQRLRIDPRRLAAIAALFVYPVAVMAYVHMTSLVDTERLYRASLFEDGHPLLPASEMLRGEVLYRDVTPGHGALSDGVIDYAGLRLFGETLGAARDFRGIVELLLPLALYFLGLAASGSAEVGFLSVMVTGVIMKTPPLVVRPMPALFALACAVVAVRLRNARWFAGAGVLFVVAFLTSLDFALFSAVAIVAAVYAFSGSWRRRGRAAMYLLGGLVAAALPALAIFAFFGIIDDFFRVTFLEVLTLGSVYAMPLISGGIPGHATAFPELFRLLFDPATQSLFLWFVVAVVVAAIIAASPRRIRRREAALLIVGVWIVAASASFAERQHAYFEFAVPAFLLAAVIFLWRRRSVLSKALAILTVWVVLVIGSPTVTITVLTILRAAEGPIDPGWAEYTLAPRARGALLPEKDFDRLAAAQLFLSRLAPNETYFDFVNLPLLHFLLDKPCPIRQYEVPFYQTESLQREVIARLEQDRSVVAALIVFDPTRDTVDLIPNSERTPLVWRYLQENFEPAFNEQGVVFWRRK